MEKVDKIGFPQERKSTPMVIKYQMFNTENIQTSNIIQTEQTIFMNIFVSTYTYMYLTAINEKKA